MAKEDLLNLTRELKQALIQLAKFGLWSDYITDELIPKIDTIVTSSNNQAQFSNVARWFNYFKLDRLYMTVSGSRQENDNQLQYLYKILTGKDAEYNVDLVQDVKTIKTKTEQHHTSLTDKERYKDTIAICDSYLDIVNIIENAITKKLHCENPSNNPKFYNY